MPINTLQTFLAAANSFGAAGSQRSSPGPFDGGAVLSIVFAGTRSFTSGLFTTVMFLYFLLVAGDSFLRRLVEVLPRFASKRQAVDISQQIGRDISAYLLTITLMNALVGAATALIMWSTGVEARPQIANLCERRRPRGGGASPSPGGALWRHPCDRRRNGDADASGQTIHT
jgi:predicted PurR-regulated permease PerM